MSTLSILGIRGDEKLTWDPRDDLQVRKAHNKFEELLSLGYLAFVSEDIGGTKRGRQISEFEPDAERLIMVPPMQGG